MAQDIADNFKIDPELILQSLKENSFLDDSDNHQYHEFKE